jgi:hypothetical protein
MPSPRLVRRRAVTLLMLAPHMFGICSAEDHPPQDQAIVPSEDAAASPDPGYSKEQVDAELTVARFLKCMSSQDVAGAFSCIAIIGGFSDAARTRVRERLDRLSRMAKLDIVPGKTIVRGSTAIVSVFKNNDTDHFYVYYINQSWKIMPKIDDYQSSLHDPLPQEYLDSFAELDRIIEQAESAKSSE